MSQSLANEIKQIFKELTNIQITATFMNKGAMHTPTTLIKGREKGVYAFFLNEECCFKVGKAGTESQARWNSQHYNLDKSTPSTFPKSFLSDLPNFIQYFEGSARNHLVYCDQILSSPLGANYKVTPKTLKPIGKIEFKNIQQGINIQNWIKENICRFEFKFQYTDPLNYDLDLLEKLVSYKLRPIYEG